MNYVMCCPLARRLYILAFGYMQRFEDFIESTQQQSNNGCFSPSLVVGFCLSLPSPSPRSLLCSLRSFIGMVFGMEIGPGPCSSSSRDLWTPQKGEAAETSNSSPLLSYLQLLRRSKSSFSVKQLLDYDDWIRDNVLPKLDVPF